MTTNANPVPVMLPLEKVKAMAAELAVELAGAAAADAIPGTTGGGSAHRRLPEELRSRFILVRAALFTRGIFDPVLARFDTASAPQASTKEIANQLAMIAESI